MGVGQTDVFSDGGDPGSLLPISKQHTWSRALSQEANEIKSNQKLCFNASPSSYPPHHISPSSSSACLQSDAQTPTLSTRTTVLLVLSAADAVLLGFPALSVGGSNYVVTGLSSNLYLVLGAF